MLYELGLDAGCAEFRGKKFRSKKILILETEKYHYQRVLSDIAGQDIADHNDDPATLIRRVRDRFSAVDESRDYPVASAVWIAYNQCLEDISSTLPARGYTLEEIRSMPVTDFVRFTRGWIRKFKG